MVDDVSSVLIVDSNEAFATMLQESLEQEKKYRATVCHCGEDALQAVSANPFDLAIVDVGVDASDGLDGTALARELRRQQADLRLMLIPLEGEDIPPDLADLNVQGTLPKPFFLPELPDRISEALERPLHEEEGPGEAARPEVTPERTVEIEAEALVPDALQEHIPEITEKLAGLAQEINADAVLLTRQEEVVASAGRLSSDELSALAEVVAESWHTSARVAQILGREQLRFEQSVEGGEHMFYSLAVAEGVILSLALRTDRPLGIIRHQAKQTARALRALVSSAR